LLRRRRIEHVGPDPAGTEDVPAAFGGRLFRCPADNQIAPVAGRDLDVESQLLQQIGRDQRMRMRICRVDRVENDDLLALVPGLRDESFGQIEIALAGSG
jgi:hypothetical protein